MQKKSVKLEFCLVIVPTFEKNGREYLSLGAGADLGFSWGGGGADFQKIFENFDDLFFF